MTAGGSLFGATGNSACRGFDLHVPTPRATLTHTRISLCHCHVSDHMLAGMVARYEVTPR